MVGYISMKLVMGVVPLQITPNRYHLSITAMGGAENRDVDRIIHCACVVPSLSRSTLVLSICTYVRK
jgi:hypothetical protein